VTKISSISASKRLSDLIRRPYDLYRPGIIDEYFMGLSNQIAQAMDDSITGEVGWIMQKLSIKNPIDKQNMWALNWKSSVVYFFNSHLELR
jgi:hypothetical protein